MTGIFGFYPFGEGREKWEAARFLYYGLTALQGRGQEAVSIATLKKGKFNIINKDGLVEEAFKDLPEGHIGIGQVSAYPKDYLIHLEEPLEIVLVGDGKPNLHEDKREAFKLFTKKLAETLKEEESILKVIEEVKGGYSFIALTEREEMIVGRDLMGIKPLEVGSVGFDLGIVASESCALDVVGAQSSSSVKSGEIIIFDPLSIVRKESLKAKRAYCSFEYVYLARLDSIINNIPVYDVRERIGEILAKKDNVKADVVIGIPDTALPFSLAYSKETNIPVKLGFVRTGRHTRTAIKPTQLERLMGVQLKLNPIVSSVEGKDIILIDDSVVRGNTLKNTVWNLKRKGAKRIHVRIGSPLIISHCPFGTEIPPKDELIGRALTKEEIAEIVGADSFEALNPEELVKAIGLDRKNLCLGCFTGEYPE
ncbi:Amidophosphoribosyltransferase [archaeon HR06]|nr:Amidophosphoribosyltransferase [archaeon HR06]